MAMTNKEATKFWNKQLYKALALHRLGLVLIDTGKEQVINILFMKSFA